MTATTALPDATTDGYDWPAGALSPEAIAELEDRSDWQPHEPFATREDVLVAFGYSEEEATEVLQLQIGESRRRAFDRLAAGALAAETDLPTAAEVEALAAAMPGVTTTVEWRVTGNPNRPDHPEDNYPLYNFVWTDERARTYRGSGPTADGYGETAEAAARNFAERVTRTGNWTDGPHLSHRTVTITDWTDA